MKIVEHKTSRIKVPGDVSLHETFLVTFNYDTILWKLFLDKNHFLCTLYNKITTYKIVSQIQIVDQIQPPFKFSNVEY